MHEKVIILGYMQGMSLIPGALALYMHVKKSTLSESLRYLIVT